MHGIKISDVIRDMTTTWSSMNSAWCFNMTAVKSWLNTVTTSAKVDASLLKFFRIGSRPLFSADDVYKPDQRPRLGIGVKISSIRPEDAVLTFDVKQKKRLAKSTDYVRGRHVLNSYTQVIRNDSFFI